MPKDMFGDEVVEPAPAPVRPHPRVASWDAPDQIFPAGSTPGSGWAGETEQISTGPGSTRTSQTRTSPLGPPLQFLGGAGACVVASLVLGLLSHGKPGLAVGGWMVGGFATIGLIALFTLRDGLRRTDAWYTENPATGPLRSVLVVLAVATVALNAYQFAYWAARR